MFEQNGKHNRSNSSYSSFNDAYLCDSKKEKEQEKNATRDLFDWVDVVTVALVTVILVFTFVIRVATISGESMENTFHDGERVVISDVNYTPKQGDVVIISRNYYNDPNIDPNNSNYEPIIKRVIATENQKIEIRPVDADVDSETDKIANSSDYIVGTNTLCGYIYVDGKKIDETYIKVDANQINPIYSTQINTDYTPLDFAKGVTVPKGCVFVMGDNRNNSHDSRYSDIGNRGNGMVDNEFIIGKVYYRIFPFNVFGGVYK